MLRKFVQTLRSIKASHEDARVGRQLVGHDRYGNKYYQYYDDKGNETRRVCDQVNKTTDDFLDPLWDKWLRRIQKVPYTSEELEELYKQQRDFQKVVHNYEKADSQMMKEFRKTQKQNLNPQTTREEGHSAEFKPGEWTGKQFKK